MILLQIDGPPIHQCPHLGTDTPTSIPASAVVCGKIYVIGGRLDSSYEGTDIVEKYDPVSDEWTTNLEPMPSKRSGIVATSIDGSIYVLGGERCQGTFDNNERYNPANNIWTVEAPMPTARHGLGVVSIDDNIYMRLEGDRTLDCLFHGKMKSTI